jgi:osmotically-inducible protein OsmY
MLPAAIAAGVAGFAVTLPAAHAQISPDKTVEQNAQYAESTIKDAWLDGKLETALLFNEHLNSFAIDTEVKNGVAYLRGSVESDIDRDLAGQIAESIEGVSKVKNDLAVDKAKATAARESDSRPESSGFKADVMDATLTAEVKTELLINSNTQGMSINVDTEDGVVTLSGQVASEQEKELAGQIAANRDGTQSVRNMLTVEDAEEAE